MPTSTKALRNWKSTGNPLTDALQIMALAPGPIGMASEEDELLNIAGDLLKVIKGGDAKAAEGLGQTLKEAGQVGGRALKADPQQVTQDLIKQWQAKQAAQVAPAAEGAGIAAPSEDIFEQLKTIKPTASKAIPEAPTLISKPTTADTLEQVASKGKKTLSKAPKDRSDAQVMADLKKAQREMASKVPPQSYGKMEEAMQRDMAGPAQQLRGIYQYLKGKFPDTPRIAYNWDKKIADIDFDMQNYMSENAFRKLMEDINPGQRELGYWRYNQLRSKYGAQLQKMQDLLAKLHKQGTK